ncbi:C-type lectin domain family 9 member A-like [Natator depressus]|uniref:C-type lectin domain family 9 member A-like n=1 Tax=Natator depressus TaxID=27790 RepID=UPI003EB8038F
MEVENIILSDTVEPLTTGLGYNCSPCDIDWVQRAASCYLLSEKEKTWQESRDTCAAMSDSLVKTDTQEELVQSHLQSVPETRDLQAGRIRHGQQHFFRFWTGLNHDNDIRNWAWADGSAFSFQLFQVPGAAGCVYMQEGDIHMQSCTKWEVNICKKPARFGSN